MRRSRRRRDYVLAERLRCGKAAGQQADGGGFDVAFAAGDLPGKAQPRFGLEPQRAVEQLWRIDEGVAMQPAKPGEFRVGESRDGAENPGLLTVLELGLE